MPECPICKEPIPPRPFFGIRRIDLNMRWGSPVAILLAFIPFIAFGLRTSVRWHVPLTWNRGLLPIEWPLLFAVGLWLAMPPMLHLQHACLDRWRRVLLEFLLAVVVVAPCIILLVAASIVTARQYAHNPQAFWR